MNDPGGKGRDSRPMSGAELFSAGRFSEALNEYDDTCESQDQIPLRVSSPSYSREVEQYNNAAHQDVSASVSHSKSMHTVCNRAAAKLKLEMCRSCLRDCDEAIGMDPYCLRAHILKGRDFGCINTLHPVQQ